MKGISHYFISNLEKACNRAYNSMVVKSLYSSDVDGEDIYMSIKHYIIIFLLMFKVFMKIIQHIYVALK
jgi:hypothetical protein